MIFCCWTSILNNFSHVLSYVTFLDSTFIVFTYNIGPSQGLKIRGARSSIICPPGWDRVNCSAINPLATALSYQCVSFKRFKFNHRCQYFHRTGVQRLRQKKLKRSFLKIIIADCISISAKNNNLMKKKYMYCQHPISKDQLHPVPVYLKLVSLKLGHILG